MNTLFSDGNDDMETGVSDWLWFLMQNEEMEVLKAVMVGIIHVEKGWSVDSCQLKTFSYLKIIERKSVVCHPMFEEPERKYGR